MDTQVLIVGAGPTGLTLAGELKRRGVDCVLIESNEGPLHWDRATIVHPRTMELFATLGLDGPMLEAGIEQRYIYIYSDGELLGQMDLAENGSRFGFNVNVSEEVTESVLTGHLEAQGGSVEHGRKLTGLRQLPDHVVATIEHNGSEYEISAEWIVGCGGLHSPVRELSGIGFEGHDIPEEWAVLDTTLADWPHGHDANFAFLDKDSVILTPLPDLRWRAYIRPTAPDSDLTADAARGVERYAAEASVTEVENPTRFHCHTKVASRYREGRALLAGDAAHVCSPSQGHGMNTGIHDSFNLAWKLAMVCKGEADPSLLDSYESERKPVARMVMESGDDFEAMQLLKDDDARRDRDEAIRATFADEASRLEEILGESQLNISYSGSSIVAGTGSGIGPGDRLPDEAGVHARIAGGTGHSLVVVGRQGESPADIEAIEQAHSGHFDSVVALEVDSDAADRLGVGETAMLAVRPDGYVGFRVDGSETGPVGGYIELIRAGGPQPGSSNGK
ncbi:MAG: FAD-dependent monooxygenase [Solirubrobacterales bacterium]